MKKFYLFILTSFLLLSSFVFAEEMQYCCEKTTTESEYDGAYCINAPQDSCDSSGLIAPTSCHASSYCQLGTCYGLDNGLCMGNTPKALCEDKGGTWDSRSKEQIPQCQLGCCILADQALFTTLTRCKSFASEFKIGINYRQDISTEGECLAYVDSQTMGACVYEKEFERVCDFTTQQSCGAKNVVPTIGQNASEITEKTFYPNYLCSAGELATVCSKQVSLGCYENKVYWYDSCGNRENIYSGMSDEDKSDSWNSGIIASPNSICSPVSSSSNSCGNCDYFTGTVCSVQDGRQENDYYCKATTCTDSQGTIRKNGESWCVYDNESKGDGFELTGNRHYREVCIDGEIILEPCSDYRNEICIDSSIDLASYGSTGTYSTAKCRVNRWSDCVLIDNEDDCDNINKRDCYWYEFQSAFTEVLYGNQSKADGICLPKASPGLKINDASAQNHCNQVSFVSEIKFTEGGLGVLWKDIFKEGDVAEESEEDFKEIAESWKTFNIARILEIVKEINDRTFRRLELDNSYGLQKQWVLEANKVCAAVGDCGGYANYQGEFTNNGYSLTYQDKTTKLNNTDLQTYFSGLWA